MRWLAILLDGNMLKQIKMPLISLAFLLLVVASFSYFVENRKSSQDSQVLAEIDEVDGEMTNKNNCQPLPMIKNVKINCPLCSEPQL